MHPLQSDWKYGPHCFLRAGELVEFIISSLFGVFYGIFFDLLVVYTYHTFFPVQNSACEEHSNGTKQGRSQLF